MDFNPNDLYIVAVSGGSDSMALLDWCRQQQLSVIVAHVNYNQRESAHRDEKIVFGYCEQYDIPFYKYFCRFNTD